MNITDYIAIWGMYELWGESSIEVYNNITVDSYEWKQYEPVIRLNEHNYLEMVIDIHDVTLFGTQNYIKHLDEVLNNI